jgi:hypothetical protein
LTITTTRDEIFEPQFSKEKKLVNVIELKKTLRQLFDKHHPTSQMLYINIATYMASTTAFSINPRLLVKLTIGNKLFFINNIIFLWLKK